MMEILHQRATYCEAILVQFPYEGIIERLLSIVSDCCFADIQDVGAATVGWWVREARRSLPTGHINARLFERLHTICLRMFDADDVDVVSYRVPKLSSTLHSPNLNAETDTLKWIEADLHNIETRLAPAKTVEECTGQVDGARATFMEMSAPGRRLSTDDLSH